MASLYSTSVKVDYIDPRFDSSKRAEFRLNPELCYYSNLRLVNLGATLGTDNNETIQSPAGLYGIIKHIRLLDGAREIDSCRNVNRYLAFKNLNNSNKDNYEIGQQKHKGAVGYLLNDNRRVVPGALSTRVLSTSANTTDANKAYLDLRECLPVLERLSYLDTSLMPNLRIEVEFELDAVKLISKNTNVMTKTTPLLIAEEIMDEELKKKLKSNFSGVVWNTVENDVVQVPSVDASALADAASLNQQKSLRISGFDNKLVGRVVMMKTYTDKAKYKISDTQILGYGELGSSVAQLEEKINLRLNGRGVYSGNGLDTPAKRASALSMAWGDVNIVPYSHNLAMGRNVAGTLNNVVGAPPKYDNDNESKLIGQSDFVGMEISDRVSQLILDYERTNIKDTGSIKNTSAGLDIHIFAEVQRSLMLDCKGGYMVRYN